jgi:hypothetical protein
MPRRRSIQWRPAPSGSRPPATAPGAPSRSPPPGAADGLGIGPRRPAPGRRGGGGDPPERKQSDRQRGQPPAPPAPRRASAVGEARPGAARSGGGSDHGRGVTGWAANVATLVEARRHRLGSGVHLPREFRLVAACCRWPPSPARDEAVLAAADGLDWTLVGPDRRTPPGRGPGVERAEAGRRPVPEEVRERLQVAAARIARQNLA